MDVTYIAAYKKDLGTIPVVSGQLIYLRDADMCFYDMTQKTADDSTEVVRRSISGQEHVTTLPEIGRPGVLYLLNNETDTGVYAWFEDTASFICLASPNVDTKVTTNPDTTSTKVYIAGTTSSKQTTGQLNIDTDVYFDASTGKVHAKGFEGKASDAAKADNATKASQDSRGQDIATNYIKDISISGTRVTITKGDGTSTTQNTQDRDTHYTTGSVVTNSPTSTQNNVAANSSLYLVVMDDTNIRSAHKIVGEGATSVTSGGDGSIHISSENTQYADVVGATGESSGARGLVPAPDAGANTRYLRSDGTWAVPPNTEYKNATDTTAGLLSATDKSKLDTVARNASSVTVTRALGTGTKVATFTVNGEDFDLYCDTNTHYTSHLYAGEFQGNMNSMQQVRNPYLLMLDDETLRSQVQLKAGSNMVISAVDGVVTFDASNTEYPVASDTTSGLMSAEDKQKLDSLTHGGGAVGNAVTFTPHLQSGTEIGVISIDGVDHTLYCEQNTDTTYSEMLGATPESNGLAGLVPMPTSGRNDRFLRADGTWATPPNDNSQYVEMVGASDIDDGYKGLVPSPEAGQEGLFLKGDGTWSAIPEATQNKWGAMSAADKTKLDNLDQSLAATLSDANDYTDSAVAGLAGSAPDTLNTLEKLAAAFNANEDVVDVLDQAVTNKVDKVSGKGLSTNDYTAADKTKLAGIAEGATNTAFLPNLSAGTKIGTLTIDGVEHLIYAPEGSGGSGGGSTGGSGVLGEGTSFAATSKTFLVNPGDVLLVTYQGSGGGSVLIMIYSHSSFGYMSMLGTHSSSGSMVSTMSLINQSGTTATANLSDGTLTIGKSGGIDMVHVARLHVN